MANTLFWAITCMQGSMYSYTQLSFKKLVCFFKLPQRGNNYHLVNDVELKQKTWLEMISVYALLPEECGCWGHFSYFKLSRVHWHLNTGTPGEKKDGRKGSFHAFLFCSLICVCTLRPSKILTKCNIILWFIIRNVYLVFNLVPGTEFLNPVEFSKGQEYLRHLLLC